jgi:hypothetical protein
MPYYRVQHMWNAAVKFCAPLALGLIAWTVWFHGRAVSAELAAVYLVFIFAARAHALDRARRETPARLERVSVQIAKVKSTLPESLAV